MKNTTLRMNLEKQAKKILLKIEKTKKRYEEKMASELDSLGTELEMVNSMLEQLDKYENKEPVDA